MSKNKPLSVIKLIDRVDDRSNRLGPPLVSLRALDHDQAQSKYADFEAQLSESDGFDTILQTLQASPETTGFLATVFDLSPYLAELARQFPQTVGACLSIGFEATLLEILEGLEAACAGLSQAQLMRVLRHAKRQVALIAGLADLGGWWSAHKVGAVITQIADACLQQAVRHVLLSAHHSGKLKLVNIDAPEEGSGYVVLAMGKHGAGELNYSSDIDVIVFFDPDAPAVIDRDESVTTFVRITKALVKIMQERTADGYVFRTDLRLRPDPGSMPLAIPLPIAMNYYESRGQNWERAALIKARQAAGDVATGASILKDLTPFIWRRYLDYASIADVHSIKRQIQAHRGYGELKVHGHNVKLGRGGIREIEFFVQTQQLIAGGRLPALRGKKTIEMLGALVEHGWIEPHVRDELSESYTFLRDVEHRIQMVADAQIHSLPEEESDLQRISHLCGFDDVARFSESLIAHCSRVENHYADLFSDAPELSSDAGNLSFTGGDDDPGTIEALSALGYQRPTQIIASVRSWHFGRYPAMQSSQARERLTELTPALLSAFADSGRADEALFAFDDFLKGLPAGFQLFSLLHANPRLLSLLSVILSSAPRLAAVITRRPHVFDGLLEPGFFDAPPNKEQWRALLARSLNQARDYEDGLDRARVFAAEQKFLIGVRVLSGVLAPQHIGPVYTDLAEVMLEAMIAWVRVPFEEAHGVVPHAHFAIVGMGNLGNGELTASSDLDLMLLYEFSPDYDESNGKRALHASQYFGRFTQRLIAAMSAPTADGIVFELDFRLRPSGKDGPIATSLMAFQKYHEHDAWTWEKLALTRARVLGEKSEFGTRIETSISDILTRAQSNLNLKSEILEMRQLMDEERPANSAWDIKLAKGGLIDLEFMAQWGVLSGQVPRGGTTGAVLSNLFAAGRLNEGLHNDMNLSHVHGVYGGVLQLFRLCLVQSFSKENVPLGFMELLMRQLNLPDIQSAEAFLDELQQFVRKQFLQLFS